MVMNRLRVSLIEYGTVKSYFLIFSPYIKMGKPTKLNEIYHELGLTTKKDENNVLNNLTKVPPKEKNDVMAHTQARSLETYCMRQMDILNEKILVTSDDFSVRHSQIQ